MIFSEYTLRDLLVIHYGKSLPAKHRIDGEFPVYGSSGVTGFHCEYLVKGPGIIVGRKGSIGTVYFSTKDFFPIDTVYYIETFQDKLDLEYAYYLLQQLGLPNLNTDAAVPGLNRDIFYSVKVSIPSVEEQKAIAKPLFLIDSMISNNLAQIQRYEKLIETYYDKWFINFNFPNHEQVNFVDGIPEGWNYCEIIDLFELQRGFDLPNSKRECGSVPIYASTGIVGYHNECKVNEKTVITGRSGSLGTVMITNAASWPLNTTLWVKKFKKFTPEMVYFTLNNLDLESFNAGAAVPTLNRNDVHKVKVLTPSSDIIDKFSKIASQIFEQISALQKQNEKLKELKETLLPRLMSGELDVSKLSSIE